MNDLELIATLDDTSDPSPAVLQRALDRLSAEIALADAPPPHHRLGRRLPLAATAAAVAAAVLWMAVLHGSGGDGQSPAAQSPPRLASSTPATSQPAPPATGSPTPNPPPDASAVLKGAADAAAAVRAPIPRADQFLYVTDSNGYEAWLSIDGTHDGLVTNNGTTIAMPGCLDGIALVPGNSQDPRPQPCTPQPALLLDAPTTAQAMADYIIELATPGRPDQVPRPVPSTNSIGKTINSLLTTSYLLPESRAALFGAIPLLPGLSIAAADIPGQALQLTAVSWKFGPSSVSLVFDTASLQFVGYRTTGGQPQPAPTNGTLPDRTEIIGITRQYIVDSVGGRP